MATAIRIKLVDLLKILNEHPAKQCIYQNGNTTRSFGGEGM